MKRIGTLKISANEIPVHKNRYFFLLAAEKLGLEAYEFEKLPNMQDGILKERLVLQITDGKKSLLTLGSTTAQTSYLGMKIAVNKTATNTLLKKFNIPTTEQRAIHSEDDLVAALTRYGKIILKPSSSRAGKGVFSNIRSFHKAQAVYEVLKKNYQNIVAEKILEGKEYRVLVVNGRVFAVAEYVPPTVIGDGISSILSLIKKENVRRAIKKETHFIKINMALRLNLREASLTPRSVLAAGEIVVLHRAAPISNGGYSIDATEKIHPKNKALVERAATLLNIDIAGVDIITPSIDESIETTGGAIIEINGGPDLDVHYSVREGVSRNGAEAVLKDFFNIA